MTSILLLLSKDDQPYLPRLKPMLAGRATVHLLVADVTTITEVILHAKNKGVTRIATTSEHLLKLLLPGVKKGVTVENYAGTIIRRGDFEFLFIRELKQLVTVNYGSFICERYFSKFLHQDRWFPIPAFKWELFNPSQTDRLIDLCSSATFLSCDIETGMEEDRIITCLGITAVSMDKKSNSLQLTTFVIPFNDEYNVAFARIILDLPTPKLFQNGKYDNAYLLRYRIPVRNWSFDTINLFHSWYSELPKRLDFIAAFMLREWEFWKNEADPNDAIGYYRYNAKDCFSTAIIWLALLQETPDWAWKNYLQEFPLVFPCIIVEMRGLKRDNKLMEEERKRFSLSLEEQLRKIRLMVGVPIFNPGSPLQVLKLFQALGSGDIKNTTPPSMDKVKHRHPLNSRILSAIETYRKDIKLATSYLRDEDPKTGEKKSWYGRIFFAINPHGTDTGRLASKESHFWCGWQIHNIPRDRTDIQIKRGIVADEGFYFGECDRSQAEARDTAYLSGDTALIKAVDDETKDFHGVNASAFFGIPYEKIIQSSYNEEIEAWVHKKLDKVIRDLSKHTNHGANYNMGPQVMLDTMKIDNVIKAKKLLGLPSHWSLLKVTEYLLMVFARTYPVVKGPWYDKVKGDVASTRMLIGPTGWTRYCFGDPGKSKRDLNAYVAHPPQSLNAMELNASYQRVFREVQLPNSEIFKLGPQIHDSILFQYRLGRIDLAFQVQECMRNPIIVTDTFGIKRELVVPTDLKGEATTWADIKDLNKKLWLLDQQKKKVA